MNHITNEEAEALTGLQIRTIHKIADKGFFTKLGTAEWHAPSLVRGLIKYYQDRHGRDELGAIEVEVAKVELKRRRLKLRREQGDVIPATAVEKTWEAILTAARQQLLNLPGRMVGVIATCNSALEQQKALEREVDDILTELSKTATYDFAEADAIDPDEDGTAVKSAGQESE